jgi:hypothetical protein
MLGHGVGAQKAGPWRRHLEFRTESELCHSYCPDFKQCLKGYQSITGGGGGNVFSIELWSGVGGGEGVSDKAVSKFNFNTFSFFKISLIDFLAFDSE